MATVNEKMTALADEIRTLSGTTDTMGLDAMATTLNTENINFENNLSAQDNLISQIVSALEGKAAGGGSGGNVETYSGTISTNTYPDLGDLTIVYTNKDLIIQSVHLSGRYFSFEVIKNSIICISGGVCTAVSGCEKLGGGVGSYVYKITENNFSLTYEIM